MGILTTKDWGRLAVLGLVFYTLAQGGQFLTLAQLEAVTFSLLLSFSSVLVALFGFLALREVLLRVRWAAMAAILGGTVASFPSSTRGQRHWARHWRASPSLPARLWQYWAGRPTATDPRPRGWSRASA